MHLSKSLRFLADGSNNVEIQHSAFAQSTTLPEQQKVILHLRDVELLSFSEIAKITNTSQANVRVALSRARKKIKDLLLKQYNHGVQ